jgi:hypothetical protein
MSRSLAFLVLGALACAGSAARVRDHTYPPSFEFVERKHLESAMWQLAWDVQRLDHSLREPSGDPAEQQRVVAELLKEMEVAANGIATPGRITQHPLLNRNLPRFREQLRRARMDVERKPPNYFTATTLVGSCTTCHSTVTATSGL